MIEIELAEIEDRLHAYSSDAQADIRWLLREVRKAHNLGTRDGGAPAAAFYDKLTGLLSGGAYGVRFAMAHARARRYRKFFAVMGIDLALARNAANGELSERETEELLKQVATRLVACSRETDTLARVDDEKFAMILEELTQPEHAERVKLKVEGALAQPIVVGARILQAAASVSLQLYPTTHGDAKLN